MLPHCTGCGTFIQKAGLCQLCEIKASGIEEVFVKFNLEGKIIFWQNFESEVCSSPLDIDDFITKVKQQYRRE